MTTATRIFSRRGALALGLALLAAACAKSPSELDGQLAGGAGGAGAATPGSAQDFVVNVGDRVFFDTDSTSLNAEAQTVLGRQAQWLALYPNYTVTVEGHADERGTRDYNIALGERRANAAKNYLASLGIDPSRISVISYGKERPAELGSTEEAYAKNRRAVTVVIGR